MAQEGCHAIESTFKGLRLNMGVSEVYLSSTMLLEAATWKSIEEDTIETKGDYILGVDLGVDYFSMSAAAAYYWNSSNAIDGFGVFASVNQGPEARGQIDGVGPLYSKMLSEGDLILSEGLIANLEDLLNHVLEKWGKPSCVVLDRWRLAKELQQTGCGKMNFPSAVHKSFPEAKGFRDSREKICRLFQTRLVSLAKSNPEGVSSDAFCHVECFPCYSKPGWKLVQAEQSLVCVKETTGP